MSNHVATPPPLPEPEVWRDGKLLVFNKGATLPPRCVKTNEPTDFTLRRKLSWHEPALYFLILAGLPIYAIIALCVRKTAVVDVPLGSVANEKRKRTTVVAWLMALVGVIGIGIGTMMEEPSPFVLGGITILIVAPLYGMTTFTIVKPKKIDDYRVYLTGVCEAYLAQLPERKI